MDIHIKQLIRIENYVQQASVCNEKGITRLHYMMALELLQELSTEMKDYITALESVGEQPKEVSRTSLLSTNTEINNLIFWS
jgi:hypothetical protein